MIFFSKETFSHQQLSGCGIGQARMMNFILNETKIVSNKMKNVVTLTTYFSCDIAWDFGEIGQNVVHFCWTKLNKISL